jgi:hypothetical protein
MTSHKSTSVVGSSAAALCAMCAAAPINRARLAQLPGAMKLLCDLLGPPPAAIMVWCEQQEARQAASARAAAAIQLQQQQPAPVPTSLQQVGGGGTRVLQRGSAVSGRGGIVTPRRLVAGDALGDALAGSINGSGERPARSVRVREIPNSDASSFGGGSAVGQGLNIRGSMRQRAPVPSIVSSVGAAEGQPVRLPRASRVCVCAHVLVLGVCARACLCKPLVL